MFLSFSFTCYKVVTKVVSTIFKRLWSLKSATKTATSSRSMMKFEGGYTVETVFDGSKHGIEPYTVEISPDEEVLILDSQNSNIYKIPTPLSRYSRPKLLAGSAEGYNGHVDGKLRQARLNHPRGLTVDDSGNIYVADTMNMAIRKISDSGVVTIAGGKSGRGGHIDGPSEDARFSDDFDLVYVGSSCSLLVIDRGNQAIREIQLHEHDCSHEEDNNLDLGIAVLAAACFFGYMLALLQCRVASMISYDNPKEPKPYATGMPPAPYQRQAPPAKSVLPPLIPAEDEYDKQEDGLFTSLGKLVVHTGSSVAELFGGLFSGFKKKPVVINHIPAYHHQYQSRHGGAWPVQESFVVPREDEPPPLEAREPTPRKNYPYKDAEKMRPSKQSRPYYNQWNSHGHEYQQPQLQSHQHHQKHRPASPQTYYEQQNCETNEIVFGAVQEQEGRREAMVIKAVDYTDSAYEGNNVRSRYNYMSYSSYGY
ncbi:uncharacterized protein LOC121772617 isoform X3 [Salvia splendens]|uniref:uncharacterized protein LOC121772617 isoform X3 n=1 Tax=Salvia splendens TaxID=180675 RepID=UPI001C260177|nr:uncharacterized protein LOC121772617 isoform X3 [Salvia splendens]